MGAGKMAAAGILELMTVSSRKLGVLAAIAGFVLMVFEIAAARILAPTIGSSTYVWTSVIGVIIMALSTGYWAGGRLADKRDNPRDIARLFLLLSVAISLTTIIYSGLLASLAAWQVDIRLAAVVASLLLFAPASFVLGAISPYLAKLNVNSLASSGSAVANLSALNSIGGIVGTFLTGFVLFGFMGVRDVMVLLAIGTLVVSWFCYGVRRRGRESKLLVLVLLLGVAAWPGPSVWAIDTPTAHYVIEDMEGAGRTLRTLATGPGGKQSGVYLDNPKQLAFWYTSEMAAVVEAQPTPRRIAVLGAGAYTLPAYLASKYPSAQIDVVDIDPQLLSIAEQHFGYVNPPNVTPITADARAFVNAVDQPYDIILVDVFGDDTVPESLMTAEYGRALKRALAPNGAVVVNMIASPFGACRELFEAATRPYLDNFARGYYKQRSVTGARSNIVALFGTAPAAPHGYRALLGPQGPVYTDDFNPVIGKQFACKMA